MKGKLLTIFLMAFCLYGKAQIFYKIEKTDNPTSYIFGSHHLSPIDIVEKSNANDYFKEVDQIIGELDLTLDPIAISLAVQPHMMAPSDSTLSVLLEGENWDALNEQFEKWTPVPGMKLQMLDPLKPMAVTTMVVTGLSSQIMPGFDPSQQLDTYFFKQGEKEGKKIVALETPDYQGEVLFDTTPLKIQADALIEMLTKPEETIDNTKRLNAAYMDRDLDAMLEISKESEDNSNFMENVLYRRNQEWLQKLPDLISESSSFIVVGALHLAGPKGILEGLKNEGYIITPIY